ncbi:hypothetical protein AT864_02149 [Anoxybacillus sp. P3H1B]|uniref:transglutaminase domain-containing protein n=1 Tax=Anoxybacillus sp. P3H1B TaxID=1769293 RepID=UPI0007914A2E|nr:transglutaminase domain-containing protein [Anoxybacillus sp. P3H1B]KXG09679.1 hypothetical protein AT864_02149 [Anoxybacillus sp. P3H1B]
MKLVPESSHFQDYLEELNVVNFSHPLIQQAVCELFHQGMPEMEKAKTAYEFVRDRIAHSWDIQSSRITCKASEVLYYREGICYAKANLLAALLRSQKIATDFCYQRLRLFNSPDQGYCIHALNAVFLRAINRWIRLDARGNKQGIHAEFSLDQERLAFSVQPQWDEQDLPVIYTKPNPKTIATLRENTNALVMYQCHLPENL